MHIEMMSLGKTGRSQFTLNNTSSEAVPVETIINRIELDENGKSHETLANEDFLVFPPQALIKPGTSQVFRVQWVGEPNLSQSQSYMISVAQIPVKMGKAKSAVQVVMSFGVVVDVAPPQGHSDLKLIATGIASDKKGRRHATITVANPSNVHALLETTTVHVSAGTWTKTYSPSEITQSIGIGLVQPGKRRKFMLPDVLPAGASAVQAHLDLQAKQ